MKITKNENTTEIRDISDLTSLAGADIGSPALLIVYMTENTSAGESAKEFFRNAPFITVAAGDISNADVLSLFDLSVSEDDAAELPGKLYKDKSRSQIDEINAIFIAARKGASQEELLTMESKAFYRLMADKNGGGSNE